jgi:type I restriction enzyme S subunit
LNEQLATVERARADIEAQIEAARALPAAYLRAVFNIPEVQKCPRKRLGEVCHLLPSKSISTDGDVEVCAITTACLSETGFQPSGVKKARMWARDVSECLVSTGEILIARSNTPELVGRSVMYDGSVRDAVASDLTIRILPNDMVKSAFLAGYLSFLYVNGYWKERAGGASGSMKKITRSQIQEEEIPVPSLECQERIVIQFSMKIADTSRLQKTLGEQFKTMNKFPAALLHRAFNGEC